MKKTTNNLVLLNTIFVTALIVCNAISAKLFDAKIGGAVFTVGALVYFVTFLITDLISEIFGKEEASKTVKYGFVCQIIAMILIYVGQILPAVDHTVQQAYTTMFGNTFMFIVASLTAYLVSQKCDVYIFDKIKTKIEKKVKSNKFRNVQSIVGQVVSQFIDTVIYVSIAFGLGLKMEYSVLINMIISQFVFKSVLSIVTQPIFTLLTRKR